jgi:hypothetical protein
MGSEQLYDELWSKKRLSVIDFINQAIKSGGEHQIQLTREEFDAAGNRESYRFNLEFEYGEVSNNIGGSAVARDLARLLQADELFAKLAKGIHVKINLDDSFMLNINSWPR